VELPKGNSIMGCKWIFTEYKFVRSNERYNAWLVAKGFTKTYGINYFEICSIYINGTQLQSSYLFLVIWIVPTRRKNCNPNLWFRESSVHGSTQDTWEQKIDSNVYVCKL